MEEPFDYWECRHEAGTHPRYASAMLVRSASRRYWCCDDSSMLWVMNDFGFLICVGPVEQPLEN